MAPPITTSSQVVRSQNQVATQLGGEVVILGVEVGQYFGLNDVGARVWALVESPVRVSDICTTIADEYQVEPAECERDVLELLGDMREKGLIDVAATSSVP